MTNGNIKRLRRIYGIILSISLVIAGICLIAGCIAIYNAGEHPYSRETVGTAFSKIAVPVYASLILTAVGFILEFLYPAESEKRNAPKDYPNIINRLAVKKDLDKCDKALADSIRKERDARKRRSLILTVILCISSAVFLVYALNSNNFHQSQINESVIDAMKLLFPCLAVPFVYGVFTAYSNEKSFIREIELIKQAPSSEAKNGSDKKSPSAIGFSVLRYILLAVGIGILIFGYISGGTADVLTKAVNICTECIGLG